MSKQAGRQQTKQSRRRDRREENRRLEVDRARAARKNLITAIGAVIVTVLVIGAFVYIFNATSGSGSSASASSSGTPVNTQANPPVDNISCDAGEQLAYHVHAHLTIYIKGSPVQVPATIGIPADQSCFYWMHTHDASGVIHLETPKQDGYTLGTFLNLWGNQFPELQYPSQLDLTNGWQVYVDGKLYAGDFHKIQFNSHMLITMAYQSPGITPDTVYNWGSLTQ